MKKVAIIYTSITKNTEKLAELIYANFKDSEGIDVSLHNIKDFDLSTLGNYDALAVGTYTWGDGDLPRQMRRVYEAIEQTELSNVVTGVFGTGDTFYPHFCRGVDMFRDMLNYHTKLAVTLKVELSPQEMDYPKARAFVDRILRVL